MAGNVVSLSSGPNLEDNLPARIQTTIFSTKQNVMNYFYLLTAINLNLVSILFFAFVG
jgi:hypothetical protein